MAGAIGAAIAGPAGGAVGGAAGSAVTYLSDIGARLRGEWRPVVFGNWMKDRIERLLASETTHVTYGLGTSLFFELRTKVKKTFATKIDPGTHLAQADVI